MTITMRRRRTEFFARARLRARASSRARAREDRGTQSASDHAQIEIPQIEGNLEISRFVRQSHNRYYIRRLVATMYQRTYGLYAHEDTTSTILAI